MSRRRTREEFESEMSAFASAITEQEERGPPPTAGEILDIRRRCSALYERPDMSFMRKWTGRLGLDLAKTNMPTLCDALARHYQINIPPPTAPPPRQPQPFTAPTTTPQFPTRLLHYIIRADLQPMHDPITGQLMRTPVLVSSGVRYELDSILQHATQHTTCPVTGQELMPIAIVDRYMQAQIADAAAQTGITNYKPIISSAEYAQVQPQQWIQRGWRTHYVLAAPMKAYMDRVCSRPIAE